MQLPESLRERRTSIIDRWTDFTLRVYPQDSVRLMRREKDRFQNPVGHVTRTSLERLYDGLLSGLPVREMAEPLDNILRIRAVQDLRPSEALDFLVLLKRAVRDELGTQATTIELSALDTSIDQLVLFAFDLYVQCRQKIYELRLGEIKRRASSLLGQRGNAAGQDLDEPTKCGRDRNMKGGCGA